MLQKKKLLRIISSWNDCIQYPAYIACMLCNKTIVARLKAYVGPIPSEL